MMFTLWLRELRNGISSSDSRQRKLAKHKARPAVEFLEDRNLLSGWTSLGPAPISNGQVPGAGPVSGRITGIAPDVSDPNTIFVATAGGGVWRTINGGTSWQGLTDNLTDASGNPIPLFMGAVAEAHGGTGNQVIYAGLGEANNAQDSYWGEGILVSTDGGTTWVLTGQAQLQGTAISRIAIDPQNANIAYAAVANNPVNGTGASVTGIYKTTNAGGVWTNVTSANGKDNSDPWSDVVIDPTTSGSTAVLFAAVGNSGGAAGNGVFTSTDGGTNWNPVGGGMPSGAALGRISLALSHPAASAKATLYASIATTGFNSILRNLEQSTDGGTTWTDIKGNLGGDDYLGGANGKQGAYDNVIEIDPTNASEIFVAGVLQNQGSNPNNNPKTFTGGGIEESQDGGKTWREINFGTNTSPGNGPHTDYHALAFDASGSPRLLVGNDGGIWRLDSNDFSTPNIAWTDLNSNLNITQFTGTALDPTTSNLAYGGTQDNGTDRFNGTPSWTNIQGGDGGISRLDPTNHNRLYQEFEGGVSLQTSTNPNAASPSFTSISSGIVFHSSGVPAQPIVDFTAPYVLDSSGDILYGSDYLNLSTNQGGSWSQIGTPGTNNFNPGDNAIDAIAVAPSNKAVVYVSANGKMFVTQNATATPASKVTWTEIDLPSGGAGAHNSIAVDPSQPGTAYAAVNAFTGGGKHVFMTTTFGASWTDISASFPDVPADTVAISPGGTPTTRLIYVGTDVGIYATVNTGATWTHLLGLPNAQVIELQFASGLNLVAAGTHGRGLFEVTTSAPMITAPGDQTADEGASQPFNLGSFSESDGGPWNVDVNWGDGSADTKFTVSSSGSLGTQPHTFGEEKGYTVTITVQDASNAEQASATFKVTVNDQAVVQASAITVKAVEGAGFTGVPFATYTDPGGAEPNPSDPTGGILNHYTVVSIDWGDSTPLDTSSGVISYSGSAGSQTDPFTVSGDHTYGEEGTYTIKAIIDHEGTPTTLTSTADVSDPKVIAMSIPVIAKECIAFTAPVATFMDPGGAEPNPSDPIGGIPSHYTAMIDWGDLTPPSPGTITFSGSPGSKTDTFTVTASHTFAEEGSFTVTTTINHEGIITTVKNTATVRDNYGLLLLDPTGSQSLMVTGNGNVTVTNCGAVVVDSSSSSAIFLTGKASVTAAETDVTGAATLHGQASLSGELNHEAATPDPIALPLPPAPSTVFAAVHYSGSAPLTLPAGTYVGGIIIDGSGPVTLSPGVYYMQGGGFTVTGQGSVSGPGGVLIVNAPASATDTISFTGQAKVNLTASTTLPGAYAAYDGITILQDPASANPISVTGQANLAMTGTLYAPNALLMISGLGTPTVSAFDAGHLSQGGVIVAYDTMVTGNGKLTINADPAISTSSTPGPLSQYLLSIAGSKILPAGSSFLIALQAADAQGNPITSYSGPAAVTASISPTSLASDFPATIAINSRGLGLFLATLEQAGTYTISIAGGPFYGSLQAVTVTSGPASKLAFAAQPVDTPTGTVLPPVSVQVLDVYGNVVTSDNTDSVTLAIAAGPGTFSAGSTVTVPVQDGLANFDNLALTTPGSYALSAQVPFLYTGPNSLPFEVAPLQVVPGSFAGTPSGFSLQFNTPILVNSLTPVLYGEGFGAAAPVPSVTLTQTADSAGNPVNNPIAGSLVLSPATNTLTFVATDTALMVNNGSPILPDGNYTVRLTSSGASGFAALDSGGGFLDGLGSGTPGSGDFVTTFTVSTAASGADVVWVPATADGPAQPLEAPGNNQAGGGYPIYLDDATGSVTSVTVTFNYDPTLLSLTGVNSNSGLPGSTFTLLSSSTPGHAMLEYTGPATAAALLSGGEVPLGFLSATVPSGTSDNPLPYRAKDLLTLTGLTVSGTSGPVSAVSSGALHLVAYVGDAGGNGSYDSHDAVLITRVALQADSGFAAYPLVDPVIVADTDGSGFIPADASLQVNAAGVNFPTANLPSPPIPAGTVFVPLANNVDPTVSLPADLQVGQDDTLTVPVNIDDAHPTGSTGLIEAHLALTYDPRQFTVSAADVHLGSVLTAGTGWSVVPIIDSATGRIAIALASTTAINSSLGGSLVTIDFHVASGWRQASGASSIELVASVNLDGQVVATELEDTQGTFTLTPAPSNGFDPRIDLRVALAALPTTAATGPVPVEAGPPVATENAPLDISVSETTTPVLILSASPAPVVEASGDVTASARPEPAHGGAFSAHEAALIVAASAVNASLWLAAPGTAFAVTLSGPRLSDQFFQALARWPVSDASAVYPFQLDALPMDGLDSRGWDEMGQVLEWRSAGNCYAPAPGHTRRVQVAVPAAAEAPAADQVFAQLAEEMDDGE